MDELLEFVVLTFCLNVDRTVFHILYKTGDAELAGFLLGAGSKVYALHLAMYAELNLLYGFHVEEFWR